MQDDVDARVIVAGLSTTCSQKIHNQLVCNSSATINWFCHVLLVNYGSYELKSYHQLGFSALGRCLIVLNIVSPSYMDCI